MDKHEEDTAVESPGSAPPERGAADQPGSSADEGELKSRVESLESELEEAKEQHLRAVAELENVRRRAARDVENAHKYGVERLARELLTVKDTMEMGVQAAESNADAAMAEGFKATLKLLDQTLAKFGISEVESQDQPFDPELHEAMAAQPSASQEPGTVLNVVQKGYRIHDRLLRPARVIVSRAEEG